MEITARMVADLRDITGAGMMDCKKALVDAEGNMDKAADLLRERGIAKAAKKQGRIAAEGTIECYIHGGGACAALVEWNCETDFVAKNPEFKELLHNVAMQVVANRPLCVSIEELPQDKVDAERAIYRTQLVNEGKPEAIIDKIVEGKIGKYYKENCLVEQAFVMDGDINVGKYIANCAKEIGADIKLVDFVRMEKGEGIEKRVDDFAAEVASMVK